MTASDAENWTSVSCEGFLLEDDRSWSIVNCEGFEMKMKMMMSGEDSDSVGAAYELRVPCSGDLSFVTVYGARCKVKKIRRLI